MSQLYYSKIIGDGKLPNKYFVFHEDNKMYVGEDGCLETINDNADYEFLGEFQTYKEALSCVYDKAYYPRVIIEDRISGVIFESYCIQCQCCGAERYESIDDTKFTRDKLGVNFK